MFSFWILVCLGLEFVALVIGPCLGKQFKSLLMRGLGWEIGSELLYERCRENIVKGTALNLAGREIGRLEGISCGSNVESGA